jgi:hypothetical protein
VEARQTQKRLTPCRTFLVPAGSTCDKAAGWAQALRFQPVSAPLSCNIFQFHFTSNHEDVRLMTHHSHRECIYANINVASAIIR